MACPLDALVNTKSAATFDDCTKKLHIARDIMEVLNGKWKMEVILMLLHYEKRRFKELQKDISGVSAKVLSNVLKDLEEHHIVNRNIVFSTLSVEYALTEYGKSMKTAIAGLVNLGLEHRKEVLR